MKKVLVWILIGLLFSVIVYAFFSDDPFIKAIGRVIGKVLPWLKNLT